MRISAFIILFLFCFSVPAAAEKRIALLVGNASYSAVTPLDNAASDAELLAGVLGTLGFEVSLVTNTSQQDLKTAIAAFGRALRTAGPETVGLFYYAGHGVQSFGANYLLPVDAELTDAADLDLVGVEAAAVLRQMASARNRTNIVILDACRNNPFQNIRDLNDNGLAEMKAPTGTFLAYATAPSEVALDGLGTNSPFTKALAEAIKIEDAPIEQVFKQVRVKVLEQTDGLQTPWDTSSLTREFVFKASAAPTPEQFAEEQLWQSVQASQDPVQLLLFLRSYPDGLRAEDARNLLEELMAKELGSEAETVAAAPAPALPKSAPASEADLMETARTSGAIQDYQAYLDAYPDGIFSELVKIEIAAIAAQASTDPEGPPPATQEVAAAPEIVQEGPAPVVWFDRPLEEGGPEIVGKTILEVAASSPLFSPIEGLPEAMWMDQQCSNCHQWTRESLCDQGKFYQKQNATRALTKEHPFGGAFKRNLKHWAGNDCR